MSTVQEDNPTGSVERRHLPTRQKVAIAGILSFMLAPPIIGGIIGHRQESRDHRSEIKEHLAFAESAKRCLDVRLGTAVVNLSSMTQQQREDCGLTDVPSVDMTKDYLGTGQRLNGKVVTVELPSAAALQRLVDAEQAAAEHLDGASTKSGTAAGATFGLVLEMAALMGVGTIMKRKQASEANMARADEPTSM